MGENDTFVGGEGTLQAHGVEVVNLSELSDPKPGLLSRAWTHRLHSSADNLCFDTDLDSCKKLMNDFIKAKPEVWNEVSSEVGDPSQRRELTKPTLFAAPGHWRDVITSATQSKYHSFVFSPDC